MEAIAFFIGYIIIYLLGIWFGLYIVSEIFYRFSRFRKILKFYGAGKMDREDAHKYYELLDKYIFDKGK